MLPMRRRCKGHQRYRDAKRGELAPEDETESAVTVRVQRWEKRAGEFSRSEMSRRFCSRFPTVLALVERISPRPALVARRKVLWHLDGIGPIVASRKPPDATCQTWQPSGDPSVKAQTEPCRLLRSSSRSRPRYRGRKERIRERYREFSNIEPVSVSIEQGTGERIIIRIRSTIFFFALTG